ncbi:MAG: type III secretion system protein [Planctomycetota bacterium]|nr:MAG: type III secretion system protein [Planctomycetota bacterium]
MAESQKKQIKRQLAIALGYKPDREDVPTILAKGKGTLAEKIIAIAKEKGIPIKEDDDLVKILYKLEINDEIPPELYEAVAELLAFIYRLNQMKK